MPGCAHRRHDDERCLDCGACLHAVVLNRACLRCGAVDPEVTIKPPPAGVVPADRLRGRRRP
jgi:hypothetical protein